MATPHPHARHSDLGRLTEDDKYRLEVYHDYDDAANAVKLRRLYGQVAAWQDAFILRRITGRSVLDVGAGYGLFTRRLREAGLRAVGIDPSARMRGLARQWHGIELLPADIHAAPFADGSFETAVIREAVEHLDVERALQELRRIVTREVLIFQTNLTWIVRAARRLIRHHEYDAQPVGHYLDALQRCGFVVQSVEYHDTLALPLSGGLLSRQWYPSGAGLGRALLRCDDGLTALARALGAAPLVCWRCLIRAVPAP